MQHQKLKAGSRLIRRTWVRELPFQRKRPKVEAYIEMDTFNSSSMACSSLLAILTKGKAKKSVPRRWGRMHKNFIPPKRFYFGKKLNTRRATSVG